MLFNNPTLAGQCNLAVGAPVPKALNPMMESVVPSGRGGLQWCWYLSLPSAELLGSSSFPAAREKFCSWRGREEQQ